MLKIYIIGSKKFNSTKRNVYDTLNNLKGITILSVEISPAFEQILKKENSDIIHNIKKRIIDESDLIILIDKNSKEMESNIEDDVLEELKYAKKLNKTIWDYQTVIDNFIKIKG